MKNRIISLLLVLALMVAMMAVGPAAMAKKNGKKAKKAKKEKVTLCHNAGQQDQHIIRVGKPAAKAHLAHGDTEGAECPPLTPPSPPAP